ncbi:MAG: hypothetical protein AABX99_02530, partial [Nanoarchaeota archaeon]
KIGAHMIGLKRIRAGIFVEKEMTSKEEFEKAVKEYENGDEKRLRKIIIPAEIVSTVYPVVEIKEEFASLILHGSPVYYKFLEKKQDFETGKIICIFGGDKFIGMFRVINEKEFFARSQFILQPIKE